MGEDLVEFINVDFKDKLSYRGLGNVRKLHLID